MTTASQDKLYDARYRGNYRKRRSGYEVARAAALEHFMAKVAEVSDARRVLDYGAGAGMHVDIWARAFPQAELSFTDISQVALDALGEAHPPHAARARRIEDGRAPFEDGTFDVVVSVEVLEHVEDLDGYLSDILRLLRPGGAFVWTTPCGNRGSIEHVFSRATGQVQSTPEGYRRWAWEDPTHLRRMRTAELSGRLASVGFEGMQYRLRSHVFSFLCSQTPMRRVRPVAERLMKLDYALLRRLPNGASMLGVARRPNQG